VTPYPAQIIAPDTVSARCRSPILGHIVRKTEARVAALIRRDLEEAGTSIGTLDTLIAATAVANRATLVTHNTREFSRIPDLALDDWF
jgi:predicted nucleic acid-binding protein